MATTITWKINQLDRNLPENYVYTAHWICTGVDGDFSGSVYSTASFTGDLTTPYSDLTEQQVLGWVWESVDKDATEAAVLAQIEAQKNPVTATGTPWTE